MNKKTSHKTPPPVLNKQNPMLLGFIVAAVAIVAVAVGTWMYLDANNSQKNGSSAREQSIELTAVDTTDVIDMEELQVAAGEDVAGVVIDRIVLMNIDGSPTYEVFTASGMAYQYNAFSGDALASYTAETRVDQLPLGNAPLESVISVQSAIDNAKVVTANDLFKATLVYTNNILVYDMWFEGDLNIIVEAFSGEIIPQS